MPCIVMQLLHALMQRSEGTLQKAASCQYVPMHNAAGLIANGIEFFATVTRTDAPLLLLYDINLYISFYPRDVRSKRGTCYGNVADWLARCLSHAGRYCIKTAKPILKLFDRLVASSS